MPTTSLQTHVDALMLAVASSTDNFMVGLSSGLKSSSQPQQHHPYNNRNDNDIHFQKVNLVVAVCNASGTFLATLGGDHIRGVPEQLLKTLAATVSSSSSPETYTLTFSMESLLAGLAFLYLATKEGWELYQEKKDTYRHDDGDDKSKAQKSKHQVLSYGIALPMTLNNLAGGVAGGVLGLSVWQATLYALGVSFTSMALGYQVGKRIVVAQPQSFNFFNSNSTSNTTWWCPYVSIAIYLILALQSLIEV